jgi:hypothetical protein
MARLEALSSLASLRNRSTVMTGQLTLWAVAESACCQRSLYVARIHQTIGFVVPYQRDFSRWFLPVRE